MSSRSAKKKSRNSRKCATATTVELPRHRVGRRRGNFAQTTLNPMTNRRRRRAAAARLQAVSPLSFPLYFSTRTIALLPPKLPCDERRTRTDEGHLRSRLRLRVFL